MKAITRIRIILFALMVFGAFANFALNEWGNSLIVLCQTGLALSFLIELCLTLWDKIKHKRRATIAKILFAMLLLLIISSFIFEDVFIFIVLAAYGVIIADALYCFFKKINNDFVYETYFLFMVFLALVFKGMHWPGASVMLIFGVLFLIPYFITSTLAFYKEHIKEGKLLTIVLCAGSLATILLSVTFVASIMHWPYWWRMLPLAGAGVCVLIMIAGSLKWKFPFKNTHINLLEGLRLFKTNVILLFFMLFTLACYKSLNMAGYAPDFYQNGLPKQYYELNAKATSDISPEWKQANEIAEAYDNFMQKAEKNGFLK